MATHSSPFITPEEYLARDRAASFRSEYCNGEMFAMSGASRAHNLIVTNLVAELRNRLRSRDCEIYSNDMRVQVSAGGVYTYPDVLVVCGKPLLADQHGDVLINPLLIIEVLSESTKDYDRGGKFADYRRIASLKEYLTVSQTEMLIEQSVRQPDGGWLLRELLPANGAIPISSLGIDLSFNDVYEKVGLGS
jgi:Uma2 family endonuclease